MNEIAVKCRHDRKYTFTPAHTALVAIDLQQEFFVDGTGACLDDMRAILPRIKRLLTMVRELDCKVIHTRESYKPDLSDVHAYRRSLGYVGRKGPFGLFCVRGEPGQEFAGEAQPSTGETVIADLASQEPEREGEIR